MFGLGTTELVIILAIVVIFFGASKLPQLGSGLGKGIRNFKKGIKEMEPLDVKKEDDPKQVVESEKDKESSSS